MTALPPIPGLPPELLQHAQYEIVRELGRGGMGVVYLARNKMMDRLEVLKVMSKALGEHPEAAERFLREIRSAAKLTHPNVVAAYSVLQLGDLLGFAMEYVEGEDLGELVKARGPLPVANACYYVQQAAQGLQHAFEKGMVHRDIKPQNLILSRQGKKHIAKVLDFGLAKATQEKKDDGGLTGAGRMLGTPDFIAPEQTMDAASADIRADIYSLGCTLYFLLSGAPPFKGKSLYQILQAHNSTQAQSLTVVRPEVPAALADVVAKMMAKAPADRYQRPIEVAQALMPFIKGMSATAKAATKIPPAATSPPADSNSITTFTAPPPLPKSTAETEVNKDTQTPKVSVVAVSGPVSKFDVSLDSKPGKGVWDDLNPTVAETSKSKPTRKQPVLVTKPIMLKPWLLGSAIAGGGLLLLLTALWAAGVFKVKTREGMLVLEDLPPDAEVIVDGERITVQNLGERDPIEIRVQPGTRKVQIKKGGFQVESQEVTLTDGERKPIRVHLEPLPQAAADKPVKPSKDFTNSIGMKFNWIEPGTFTMGSPESEPERETDENQHKVKLTKGYYLAVHLVTQAQWEQVMGSGANQSNFKQNDEDQKKQIPVDSVTWNECQEFCRKLSLLEKRKYRLPTEAEWEYACRAGTAAAYWCGGVIGSDQANFDSEYDKSGKGGPSRKRTTPIDAFGPNPWGLYDMHGNLNQWCEDYYAPYPTGELQDPLRSTKATVDARVLRGGGWGAKPELCRSAYRNRDAQTDRNAEYGCRVVLEFAPVKEADSASTKAFTNTIDMKFKWIPPGTFMMGAPETPEKKGGNETRHKVQLTKGFYMGAYLVTQAQWEAVMGSDANRSKFKATDDKDKKKMPVEMVSWDDCQEFCRKLNDLEKRSGERRYRLPTEAEWEYAYRAGTTTMFWMGETISTDEANYNGDTVYGAGKEGVVRGRTSAVDRFPPNPWGLHDMGGNLCQWCEDWYGEYGKDDAKDPQGPTTGKWRIARGCGWRYDAYSCRATFRDVGNPGDRVDVCGFRLAVFGR